MKNVRFSPLGLGVLVLFSALSARAEPLLNGLAISTELGKERFIAAVYAETLAEEAQELLNASGPRRMELKVLAERLSARSLNAMWIQGMAINNSASALEGAADNMETLTGMVRRRLTSGDTLRIEHQPGQGVIVSLNGTELGRINSENFFNMMLRTWIGPVPLSTDFKEALLVAGDVDDDLARRYASIEPTANRITAVAGWVEPQQQQQPAQQEEAADEDLAIVPPSPSQERPVVDVPTPPASTPDEVTATAPRTDTATADEPASPDADAPAEQTADATDDSNAAPVDDAETTDETQLAQATPPAERATSQPAEPGPLDEEEEEEDTPFSAESILAQQRYVSQVVRKAAGNQQYPRRAIQRRQEGNVRLSVTVDRNGNVENITILEESRYSLLNREAEDLVERSAPFPPLPDELAGPTYSFVVPVTFRLQ